MDKSEFAIGKVGLGMLTGNELLVFPAGQESRSLIVYKLVVISKALIMYRYAMLKFLYQKWKYIVKKRVGHHFLPSSSFLSEVFLEKKQTWRIVVFCINH